MTDSDLDTSSNRVCRIAGPCDGPTGAASSWRRFLAQARTKRCKLVPCQPLFAFILWGEGKIYCRCRCHESRKKKQRPNV